MLMSHLNIDKYFLGQVYHGLCVYDVVSLYTHPKPDGIKFITWKENVKRLLEVILEGE